MLECLSELGYAATTTVAVGERAGVSRGALLHHFPTRARLISAAVGRLFEELDDGYSKAFAQIPADADRIDAAIDLLWSRYATPEVPPLLELFVAARTDPQFRVELEPVALAHRARVQKLARESIAGSDPAPEFEENLALCLDAIQGMAVRRILQPEAVTETLDAVKRLMHRAAG